MSRRIVSVILALFSCAFMPGSSFAWIDQADQKQQQRDRKMPESEAKAKARSLTGCVDEREGSKFVLIDANTQTPLANLEAVDFPSEGFAKHLGNTITVKGSLDSRADPVMKVRSIETVSDGCGKKQ